MLEELENARKKALKKKIIGYVIVAIVMILSLFILKVFQLSFVILVFGLIIIEFVTYKDVKEFKDLYKKNIVVVLFEKLFTDVNFNLDEGISRETIRETYMMDMGDSFSSNDYVSAKYKNINFETSDVHITETHTDSDGNTYTVTLFSGQWYIFDFNKRFKADLQVCDRRFSNARHYKGKDGIKFEKVELEDVDFNKKFNVYAKEPLDAFYVLTPRNMERFKKIKEGSKNTYLFCFIDNRLHIGVQTGKDRFEPSLFKSVNIDDAMSREMNDVKIITDFIDTLGLDNELFKN